jgi:hypothetical protein
MHARYAPGENSRDRHSRSAGSRTTAVGYAMAYSVFTGDGLSAIKRPREP